MNAAAPSRPPAPLRRTAAVLAVLFVLDLFGLGVGLISLVVAFAGTGVLLAGGLLSRLRSRPALAGIRFRRAGLYALLGLAAAATGRFQAAAAQRHADRVLAACQRYRAERGAYPTRLEDLVPGYLPSIPPVTYALLAEPFRYSPGPAGPEAAPILWYAEVPGAGRRVYHFRTGRWSRRD